MAFIDNSGDIILDAVLTDTGRFRLAKGDGSFRIVKFALGDDEINYELYDKNHASGSAYYDLQILQTPVFEAFTNNTSTMNSKLLSIPRTNLLYLPVLKINDVVDNNSQTNSNNSGYAVAVTNNTFQRISGSARGGVMNGEAPVPQMVRLDQGLDTEDISWSFTIDADLKETQYIVEIDSRLGNIISPTTDQEATPSFIDDDNIASYYFSRGDQQVEDVRVVNSAAFQNQNISDGRPAVAVIKGPQGTCLRFRIKSTLELLSSNFLFDQIGGTMSSANLTSWSIGTGTYKFIDTIVKVTGATTGYKLDIPVRFIKKTA